MGSVPINGTASIPETNDMLIPQFSTPVEWPVPASSSQVAWASEDRVLVEAGGKLRMHNRAGRHLFDLRPSGALVPSVGGAVMRQGGRLRTVGPDGTLRNLGAQKLSGRVLQVLPKSRLVLLAVDRRDAHTDVILQDFSGRRLFAVPRRHGSVWDAAFEPYLGSSGHLVIGARDHGQAHLKSGLSVYEWTKSRLERLWDPVDLPEPPDEVGGVFPPTPTRFATAGSVLSFGVRRKAGFEAAFAAERRPHHNLDFWRGYLGPASLARTELVVRRVGLNFDDPVNLATFPGRTPPTSVALSPSRRHAALLFDGRVAVVAIR